MPATHHSRLVSPSALQPPSLPLDIHENILDELKGYEDGLSADALDIFSSALVFGPEPLPNGRQHLARKIPLLSKFFYSLSVRHVWEHVRICSGARLAELVRFTAAGKKGCSLPEHTKRLVLQIEGSYDPRHAKILITRMRNVQVLVLANTSGGFQTHLPNPVAEAIATCQALQSLHFRTTDECLTFTDLFNIAGSCKKLRVLQIAALDPFQDIRPIGLAPTTGHLHFPSFEALEMLCLGPGPAGFSALCIPTPQSQRFRAVLQALSQHIDKFPALQRVHLLGPTEWTEPFTMAIKDKLEALICGSKWAGNSRTLDGWGAFQHLKWLVIVVEPFTAVLPEAMHTVETVEVIQTPLLLPGGEMVVATGTVLSELLRVMPGWRSARELVLRVAPGCGTRDWWTTVHPIRNRLVEVGVQFRCEDLTGTP